MKCAANKQAGGDSEHKPLSVSDVSVCSLGKGALERNMKQENGSLAKSALCNQELFTTGKEDRGHVRVCSQQHGSETVMGNRSNGSRGDASPTPVGKRQ